ncbi:MAG: tetratricopeptide repeat protein [Armatimonadetes bacterium]|nr:tetratricopeptide repeat protein [Armatimonadota bacterium]
MHSKLKLALAVFASPAAAFQEIIERKLLVDAFWIVGLAGLLAMLCDLARTAILGPEQAFAIGRDNPLTCIGLWMLYSLVIWGLLNWLKVQTDYAAVLTVMGWSQVILIIYYAIGVIWGIAMAAGVTNDYVIRLFTAIGMALPIIFVITVGRGLQAAGQVSFAKGLTLYIVVALGAVMGLDLLYSQHLFTQFAISLPGLSMAEMRVLPILYSAQSDPWLRGMCQIVRLFAGGAGLVLGLWWLAKFEVWDNRVRNRYTLYAAAATLIAVSIYSYAWSQDSYHTTLQQAQALYRAEKYADAAQKTSQLIPLTTDNTLLMWGFSTKVSLISDAADLYYQANQPNKALDYYHKMLNYTQNTAPSAEIRKILKAQAYNGMGMAHDIQGNYDQAIEQFRKAADIWSEFREPWVRMAVIYNRMGQYNEAIESANHAVIKLGSEAAIAQLALAQAYANVGNTKQAKAAFDEAEKLNDELTKKVGSKPADWKKAASKLTTQDLKFPLEAYPAKLLTPPEK